LKKGFRLVGILVVRTAVRRSHFSSARIVACGSVKRGGVPTGTSSLRTKAAVRQAVAPVAVRRRAVLLVEDVPARRGPRGSGLRPSTGVLARVLGYVADEPRACAAACKAGPSAQGLRTVRRRPLAGEGGLLRCLSLGRGPKKVVAPVARWRTLLVLERRRPQMRVVGWLEPGHLKEAPHNQRLQLTGIRAWVLPGAPDCGRGLGLAPVVS